MKSKNCYIIIFTMLLSFTGGNCFAQFEEADTITTEDVVLPGDSPSQHFLPVRDNDRYLQPTRKADQQKLEELRKNDAFWYVNEIRQKPKPAAPPKESFLSRLLQQPWLGPVMWVLVIGGFVAILVWFLMSGDVQLFRKSPPKTPAPTKGEIPDNIFEINFEKAIAEAVNDGNLRLAVRLNYLYLLKDLAERNIIRYSQQRPDSDYVMQLYGSGYYEQFFRITRHFEYAWYGGFNVSSTAYDKIKLDVNDLKSRLA